MCLLMSHQEQNNLPLYLNKDFFLRLFHGNSVCVSVYIARGVHLKAGIRGLSNNNGLLPLFSELQAKTFTLKPQSTSL